MNIIKDVADVRKAIKKENVKIFGVGGTPITRTEIHHLVDDYEVICAVDSLTEIESIKEKVKIKCFPLKNESGTYIKKPSKILSNDDVQKYINAAKEEYDQIAIVVMKPDAVLEKICKDNNWILIGNPAHVVQQYNDKEVFQKILRDTNHANEAIVLQLDEVPDRVDFIFDKLGEKIVIQLPVSGGGHGTFFFERKDAHIILQTIHDRINTINEEVSKKTNVIINSFFKGASLSILGSISRNNGVIVANPQHQLIDIPEVIKSKNDASGVFCGHEWSLPIPKHIREQMIGIVEDIGLNLKNDGVLGIFGTDFMWDLERDVVVPIEINARLTGVFPSFVDVQLLNDEIPIMAFHILDFLGVEYSVDQVAYRNEEGFAVGAHLLVFNMHQYKVRVIDTDIQCGVYSLDEDGMRFERKGFQMIDIKNENEFVIADGIPEIGSVYARNRKMLKVISKKSLAKSSYDLNDRGKKIVQNIYNLIKLEKYE